MLSPLIALVLIAGAHTDFAGIWKGECRRVSIGLPPSIPVELTIAPDGGVTGTVGGATIMHGRIRARHEWFEPRAFNHFEYKIELRLSGSISDGIARAGGRINLNRRGEDLEGWFVSDGPPIGPRSVIQIFTTDLVLKRVDPVRR